jgi:hypothetical protein
MASIEELQGQLAEKIKQLDADRQENTKRNQKEREKLLLEVEMERKERLDQYQKQVAAREKEQKDKEVAAEAKRQAEVAERVASEQKQYTLDETLRLQKEKLEWLEKVIADAEFVEEQHRKSVTNASSIPPAVEYGTEVSAEYPQTCADGGAAAAGTDGNTPDTPLMSDHLKNILRQATRSY